MYLLLNVIKIKIFTFCEQAVHKNSRINQCYIMKNKYKEGFGEVFTRSLSWELFVNPHDRDFVSFNYSTQLFTECFCLPHTG